VYLLSGCAATQEVTKFSAAQPKTVCIAEHKAVKEGVLSALKTGLTKHGVGSRVIDAQYVERHSMWTPSVDPNYVRNCDAIMFYVANWTWDVAMYMYYANIWVTNTGMTKKLAQASYTAGAGVSKFINAETKILEMIDSMFTEYYSKQNTQIAQGVKPEPKVMELSPVEKEKFMASTADKTDSKKLATPLYIEELRALSKLRDDGIITEDEFQKQKAEIFARE